jgi:arginyl-tRNA synthetase
MVHSDRYLLIVEYPMRDYLDAQLRAVLSTIDGVPDDFEPELEKPAQPEHGDLATNTAMRLAGALKNNPRAIAEDLADRLREQVDPARIEAIEVAGPGFINFRFADTYLVDGLAEVLAAGADFGRSDDHAGETALVEYVSANPTGPLTVGHGRNAVLGDTIATLLDWTGYAVTREYYFNDAGRQMRVLGASVRARYQALVDPDTPTKTLSLDDGTTVDVPASFPDDGYLGDYIIDIAQTVVDEYGDTLMDAGVEPFKEAAETVMFEQIEGTLDRLNISMDTFFNERDLYDDESVWTVLDRLRDAGYVYEKDDAVWFKTTAFGKEQDTVLVKSSGEPTYRLPDTAYHANKFERGFDLMIDIFGADHIATYPDVLSGVEVLGYDPDKVDVVIYQFVTLVRGGEPVKMSTRRASYVTLDELIDEVGADVTRFFFLMRSPNTHLDFDLDLAKEASDTNPVFYLQYAHARICSIVEKAEETGFSFDDEADLSLLTHEAETALMKTLLRFPSRIQNAAEARRPHRLINYLRDVAEAFTQFYGHCRIIGEEQALATARMRLAQATRIVLRNGLSILGISAPESM